MLGNGRGRYDILAEMKDREVSGKYGKWEKRNWGKSKKIGKKTHRK